MKSKNLIRIVCAAAALASLSLPVWGQQRYPGEPYHDSGTSITGAFEGWYPSPDGSGYSFLVGYFNRNLREAIDIPIGPDNKIEPGGPDRGQPTHFLPGRQWGMFVIKVPKTFTVNDNVTWSITVNGQTTQIPLDIKPDWAILPFRDANDNTPPYLSFQSFNENGKVAQGPGAIELTKTATVGAPVELTVWAADDAVVPPGNRPLKGPPVTITWRTLRGSDAEVKFDPAKPVVEKQELKLPGVATFGGKASTKVTFSKPGDYTLWVTANDVSGEGGRGFQCCWTIGYVRVSVKAGAGGATSGGN